MFELFEKCLQMKAASQDDLAQLLGQEPTVATLSVRSGAVEEFSNRHQRSLKK